MHEDEDDTLSSILAITSIYPNGKMIAKAKRATVKSLRDIMNRKISSVDQGPLQHLRKSTL